MIHCPIQAYLDFEERWKALTWKKIDLDLINKEVQSVEEVLERLREKYSKAETLEEIVKRKDQVCWHSSFRVSPPPRPYASYQYIYTGKEDVCHLETSEGVEAASTPLAGDHPCGRGDP